MRDTEEKLEKRIGVRTIAVTEAVGTVLAHDITEVRKDESKGRAFKKGHIIRQEDIEHLLRLGKDNLFVLSMADDEMHEDDAALSMAAALAGDGVIYEEEPKEGKIELLAARDGLLKVDKDALLQFNMLGEVMCSTLHSNTVVERGRKIAGTRAIPLIVKKDTVEEAVDIASNARDNGRSGLIEVLGIRKPRVGVVITGNEVYHGRIKDAFAPVITGKIAKFDGEILGIHYAPDDTAFIQNKLQDLLEAGADLLITTGGMSVDPDDITRFAIRNLGVKELYYGSAVLPGAMFLIAYKDSEGRRQKTEDGDQKTDIINSKSSIANRQSEMIPILGIPACGMYHRITVFDLVLPRILAGEHIGRKEVAELGYGGLCLNCETCTHPVCPFGKV